MPEEKLRYEVAACCRMLERLGLIDQDGHISARIPGTDQILINSRNQSRCRIGPKDIVNVPLDGTAAQVKMAPTELPIHSEIYRQRSDVLAIAHLHPPVTTILSVAAKPYVPVIFHAAIFAGGVPVYDDCRLVNTRERGVALAKIVGQERATIIRGHGAVVVADSVPAVFLASIYLEENARMLYKAYAVGHPQVLNDAELSEGPNLLQPRVIHKLWSYHIDKAGIDVVFSKNDG